MEIVETEKYCIITPLSPKLDLRQTERIKTELKNYNKVGLDLSYVKDCTIDFIECLKSIKNLGVFNIPSDIFVTLTCMNLDKVIELYASKEDFIEQKRRILRRHFAVIN